jgi:low affinity Fe/Cu permease
MDDLFRKFASRVSKGVGSVWAPVILIILVLVTGLFFSFSPAWKNDISFTATLMALLLLCFLQRSQNHSDKATHLKLDELIQAVEGARDEVASTEHKAEKHLDELKESSWLNLGNEK